MNNEMIELLRNVDKKVDGIDNRLKKIEMSVENNITDKINILFEDRDTLHNKIDSIQKDIADIKKRVKGTFCLTC